MVAIENADLLAWVVLKGQKGVGEFLCSGTIDGIPAMRARDGDCGDTVHSPSDLHGLRLSVDHSYG